MAVGEFLETTALDDSCGTIGLARSRVPVDLGRDNLLLCQRSAVWHVVALLVKVAGILNNGPRGRFRRCNQFIARENRAGNGLF
jgi:hypothetical protein